MLLNPAIRPTAHAFLTVALGILFVGPMIQQTAAQQEDSRQAVELAETNGNIESDRTGYLVRIPLPIDGTVSSNVKRTLKQLSEKPQMAVRPEDRPVVVLEFDTSSGQTGVGSELEACLSLALYLGDPDLNRLQTIAYVPANRNSTIEDNIKASKRALTGQLNGHAVLVAIAANQIALGPETAIGNAGVDQEQVKPLFREIYRSVAKQRLTLPVPVVMSMLDKQLHLFRVTSNARGVLYVDEKELRNLEESGQPIVAETIAEGGKFALLTGEQLLGFGLVRMTPKSKTELARMLDLAPNSLDGNPVEGGSWNAIQFRLPPVIDARITQWVIRSLRQKVTQENVNLIIFVIEHNIGDVDACLNLAQHIAEYNPNEIRTVAFVRDHAQGPVGLVALSCGHLIMAPEATLGGQSETEEPIDDSELEKLRPDVKTVAEEKQSDWSMMMQMLDPSLVVTRYRHKTSGQIRLMSNEEFERSGELDQWAPLGPIGGAAGVDAQTAEQNRLVRYIADDMGQIQTFYQLEESPVSMQPSASDRWVEQLAAFLSSPFVSPLLLFAAMFFFSTEMSAPGLGLPGFLSALCIILFFWSQSPEGSADWLAILMFIGGMVFIAMEIFVLPGFGVFGVGGILLVISSLVLALQEKIEIPQSSADFVQLSYSLVPVIGAGLGVIAGAVAMRKVIPHSPILRRMILEPRQIVDTGLGGHTDPEAMVDWSYLDGQDGETITRLNPSGKARIGGRVYDVISKGQMVNKGSSIVVIEAVGNRIVVVSADSDDAPGS